MTAGDTVVATAGDTTSSDDLVAKDGEAVLPIQLDVSMVEGSASGRISRATWDL